MTILRHAKTILIAVAVICVCMAVLTVCVQRKTIHAQKRDIAVAKETGKALDKVVTDTSDIRSEQKAKEDEASRIEGADVRLPDGYGAELERVRSGKRD